MVEFEQLINEISSNSTFGYVKEAIRFIVNTLHSYKNKSGLFISFNGGKDATIVLYLTQIALSILKQQLKEGEDLPIVRTVYFEEPDPFPETISFMDTIKEKFSLIEIKLPRDFKKSLLTLVADHNLQAVFMGSRRPDPYCEHLERISPSDVDKGYPPFLRINPIIDWSYEQVWEFLRHFEIPYCNLYEKGFTYLGNKKNTLQNTQLLQKDGKYLPAWEASGDHEQGSRQLINLPEIQIKQIQQVAILICDQKRDDILKELPQQYPKIIIINSTIDEEEIHKQILSIKHIVHLQTQVDLFICSKVQNSEIIINKCAEAFIILKTQYF